MDRHHSFRASPGRPSSKRKLEQESTDQLEIDRKKSNLEFQDPDNLDDLKIRVLAQVKVLNESSSNSESDRAAAKDAINVLCELAKIQDYVDTIVNNNAVPAIVRHLKPPVTMSEGDAAFKIYEHELEKGCALALGLLAIKPVHQRPIVDAGALPYLVDLLKRHRTCSNSETLTDLVSAAADAIFSLAQGNSSIKIQVRQEGGIPPLVELLEYDDLRVQKAAAAALRTLALKNDENKFQIVECNALPTLVLMLRFKDDIHYEAVRLIRNLVKSSPIKKKVLRAGVLQPVIGLLSSCCMDSQREAVDLLGQFAMEDSDCQVHIAQRGAVQPLIAMLKSEDPALREMSALALGNLALDNTHNQAGIAHNGAIEPLLNLLGSENKSLQKEAAMALHALADNEDNLADIIKAGGVQKLQDGDFKVGHTKECIEETLKRLEEKMHGQMLKHLVYLMLNSKEVQRHVVLALAHLCAPEDYKSIFISKNGIDLLLEFLDSTGTSIKRDASLALHKLALKAISVSPIDAASRPPPALWGYLGEHYLNNFERSDVTFIVEGKPFHAHRRCLLASSAPFRAMFDGDYADSKSMEIPIPDIKWDVFELMMRFIYTGKVDVNLDIIVAGDLLRAADQYLLDGLKHLCEQALVPSMSMDNVRPMYHLSEACNAMSLMQACILFALEQFDILCDETWYSDLIHVMIPNIRKTLIRLLDPAE